MILRGRLLKVTGSKLLICSVVSLNLATLMAGCIIPIPLAIFPASCEGSGLKVSFHNSGDKHIVKNGLLLVHRGYYGVFAIDRPSFDYLVEIKNGSATIPVQTKLGSFWLWPLFPLSVLPAPMVWPQDSLEIVPFIPGYDYHAGHTFHEVVADQSCYTVPDLINYGNNLNKNSTVKLLSTNGKESNPTQALQYFNYFDDRLSCIHRKARDQHTVEPHFYLEDRDYIRLKDFLKTEIEQLERCKVQKE